MAPAVEECGEYFSTFASGIGGVMEGYLGGCGDGGLALFSDCASVGSSGIQGRNFETLC